MKKTGNNRKKALLSAAAVLFWIGIWWLIALLTDLPLLPSPLDTVIRLWQDLGTSAFWMHTSATVLRILCGYICAVLLGTLLAFLCHFSRAADTLFSPLRTVIRCTPIASFIILLWLWLDKDTVPAFISCLMVVPIVWSNIQEGLGAADPLLIEMGKTYRLSRAAMIRHIYLPSVRSHFAAACVTGMGFAWKSGISAEIIAVPVRAIGSTIWHAKTELDMSELFAQTLIVVLVSLLLEKLLKRLLRKGGKSV